MQFENTDEFVLFHSKIEYLVKLSLTALILFLFKFQITIQSSVFHFSLIGDLILLKILFDLVEIDVFGKWVYLFMINSFINIVYKVMAFMTLGEYFYYNLELELLVFSLLFYRLTQIHPNLQKYELLSVITIVFAVSGLILLYSLTFLSSLTVYINNIFRFISLNQLVLALFGMSVPGFFIWLTTIILLFILRSKFKESLVDFNPYDKAYIDGSKGIVVQ